MAQYYYVGTMLPPLTFDSTLDISFEKLETLLQDNLTQSDYEKTLELRRFYDIVNLRALWKEEELDPRGRLNAFELSEALISRTGLPDYVFEYVDRYTKVEERLHHFPLLLAWTFQAVKGLRDPFLRAYLTFERELRLVMTAFRAKKLGRDLKVEFQYEDPEEDLIAQLLAQSDAPAYEPPEKYKDLKIIFDKYSDNPMALQRAVDEYRFEKVEGLVDMADIFSIERIMAYIVMYMIIEKWTEIDKDKGNQIINSIAKLG